MPLQRIVPTLLAALLCAPAATALTTIDNFMEGPTVVIDDGGIGATTEEMGGFDTANTAGGSRWIWVNATSIIPDLPASGPATATIALAAANLTAVEAGSFRFQWDGVLDGMDTAGGGALNLDLSGETQIDITAVVGQPGALANMRIWDSSGSHTTPTQPLVDVVDGVNSFLLSDFIAGGVDPSDIQAIQLRVTNVGLVAAQSGGSPSVVIQSVVATPEPGTALLLGLGLGALALRRRTA